MNDLLNTILKDTYNQTQLKHRLRILKSHLISQLFGANGQALATEDLTWLRSLPADFYHQFTKDSVYQLLAEGENQLQKIQTLIIYLPFELDDQATSNLGEAVRKTFAKPDLVLDIKYNPALIAGCALVWNGVYRDYSLRARIEEKKDEILEGFKKYLR